MGKLKELWGKTVFPEMIRRKRERKNLMGEIQHEARLAAMKDLKPELIKVYKEKELNKMTGKKTGKSFMEKLAKGLEMPGGKVDIAGMMGTGKSFGKDLDEKTEGKKKLFGETGGAIGGDIVEKILGKKSKGDEKKEKKRKFKSKKDNTSNDTFNVDDKIKKILE